MQISSMIYKRPEDDIQAVIEKQVTIRTSKLKKMVHELMEKVEWQEEALERNVVSIRGLNDRAQRAEERLKHARREIADMELEQRIAENRKGWE